MEDIFATGACSPCFRYLTHSRSSTMLKHRSIASSASAQTVTQIITQKMCTLARKRAEDPTKEPRPPRGPEACNTEPQANTSASSRPTRPTPTRPTAPKAHQPPHGQQASKPHPPQPTQAASGPAEARSARRSQARHRLAIKKRKIWAHSACTIT